MRSSRGAFSAALATLLGACVVLGFSPEARADGADESRAQLLFTEGRTALEKGDYAVACAKFEDSLAIVKRSSTLLNLAQCEEHQSRLLRAAEHWKQGIAGLELGDDRLPIARSKLEALEKRTPHITVKTAGELPKGALVSLDGAPPVSPDRITTVSVDPGHHTVTLTLPNHRDATTTVEVAESETNTVTLSVRGVANESSRDAVDPTRVRVRLAGFGAGGVGIAGFVVAGVTGGVLVSKHSAIQKECPNKICSQHGLDLIASTRSLDIANAIGWGVAIAGVTTGIVMIAVGQAPKPTTPQVAAVPLPGGGGVWVTQAF